MQEKFPKLACTVIDFHCQEFYLKAEVGLHPKYFVSVVEHNTENEIRCKPAIPLLASDVWCNFSEDFPRAISVGLLTSCHYYTYPVTKSKSLKEAEPVSSFYAFFPRRA